MIYAKKSSSQDCAKLCLLPENSNDFSDSIGKDTANWIQKNLYHCNKNLLTCHTENQFTVYLRPDTKAKNILENYRTLAAKAWLQFEEFEIKNIQITGCATEEQFLAAAEGLELAAYRFTKYFSNVKNQLPRLENVYIDSKNIESKNIEELNHLIQSVVFARNQVNEPGSILTAQLFADRIAKEAQSVGVSVEIMSKKKIEALRMGGLLAVNQGSAEDPVFIILEWKPENAIQQKPIVLVGKGITFDTGGSNLKTEHYMEDMKEDMAGGATVAATICAIAKNKIPVHVMALIPATDNRIGNRSFLPGDVITMHNGTTVEIGNTDAEGRLILADAVSYADCFAPQLIISIATLTGSAQRATGKYAMVSMGNDEKNLQKLKIAGDEVFERMVEFPFWDDYNAALKSDIADLNNLGGPEGGAIIAGKFLEHFTQYPFIHLDIAGVAFAKKSEGWKPAGGTGTGVRLLYHFLKNFTK